MIRKISISLFLFLLIDTSSAQAQNFDQWFEDDVMRVDLMFSGTAHESTYAFSGLKKEPHYSGSRTVLVDPFDYGDHKFEVSDAESGTLIYSFTYCTLFREWQTTMEAQTVRRAYNHVLRFPWPKAAIKVEVFDRSWQGDFVSSWSGHFDPASIYADPSMPALFESVDLEINGLPEEKIDILFLAEGYTENEMVKFLADAERSAGYIFSEEPFKSRRESFNIRAVKSVSKDSGTDIPGQSVWKNTILNSSFFTFGIERYMTTMDYASVCDVAANAHYDQIYILVNTDKYGGGGMYNLYSISAADNLESRAVVIHEFGHAFGGLADEYYNSAVAYTDFFNLEAEPWNPNLTTLVDFDAKWKSMLKADTPIPTPQEEKFNAIIGVYEGGGYVAKDVYRPMIDCRMHTNDAVFCPVCADALVQMINRFSGQ